MIDGPPHCFSACHKECMSINRLLLFAIACFFSHISCLEDDTFTAMFHDPFLHDNPFICVWNQAIYVIYTQVISVLALA